MMLKRIVMLIVLGLMFSSCQEIRDFLRLLVKELKILVFNKNSRKL